MPEFSIAPVGDIQTGQVIGAADAAVQLSAVSVRTRRVVVQALSTNTQPLVVGKAGVTAGTGHKLAAGKDVEIWINDLSKLYVVPAVLNEGVSFLAEVDA